jgi:hypothetical protein
LKKTMMGSGLPKLGGTTWPRPSEGRFFGQVSGAHFALLYDVTKYGAVRPAFCRQEELLDAFIAPFYRSAKCRSYVQLTHNPWQLLA